MEGGDFLRLSGQAELLRGRLHDREKGHSVDKVPQASESLAHLRIC